MFGSYQASGPYHLLLYLPPAPHQATHRSTPGTWKALSDYFRCLAQNFRGLLPSFVLALHKNQRAITFLAMIINYALLYLLLAVY